MSEPYAEVLFGLFCDVFVFQRKKTVYKGYLGPIKLAKPKPTALSSVLWPWDLWEKEKGISLLASTFGEQKLFAQNLELLVV